MIREGRLDGKVAIITGAASGIGKAAASIFAREGAKIVLADVSEEALQEITDQVTKEGGTALMKITDVCKEDEVKALVELTLKTYSQLDIVCNNAGITGDFSQIGIEYESGDNWQKIYEVNVLGAVYLTKHASPHMKERQKGAIVNTASVAGIRSGAGSNAYSASKAALINFTQTAACDLGSFNIRINAICPGLIKTGMTQMVFDYAKEKGAESKVGNRCELKRYGMPEEIANAMLFLASDEASYITGQALPVDGGITASLTLPGMKF